MALNGIDISNWQRGIDLTKVPFDFVIAKATQGRNYVSADCARQVQQAINLKKLWGVYHYVDGSGASAEMQHFYSSCKNWVGQSIFALDWEMGSNTAWGNASYLETCVKELMRLNGGIPPIIYGPQSALALINQVAKANDCGTWIAQYPNYTPTGYQAKPWNEGAYACTIRQYTSVGRLAGYAGNLDLNKFYADAAAWNKYANPANKTANTPPADPLAGKTDTQLADEVIAGKYGSGATRIKNLGARYNAVQKIVNQRLGVTQTKSIDVLARETIAGKYGVGAARKKALGSHYEAVQKRVNQLLVKTTRTYVVKSGDTLSGIAAKLGTTVTKLASMNGIRNVNLIHPNQLIKY